MAGGNLDGGLTHKIGHLAPPLVGSHTPLTTGLKPTILSAFARRLDAMLMASLRVAGFEHHKQVICLESLKESAYLLRSSFQGYWSRRITDEHRLRIMMLYHGF